jgi:hypothetical protein
MFKTNQTIGTKMVKINTVKYYGTLISNLIKKHPNPILNKSNDFDNLKENELIALLELVELISENILTSKLISKIVKEQYKAMNTFGKTINLNK